MAKAFIRKAYDHWIKENIHRFKYHPSIVYNRKNLFHLSFGGINKNFICNITRFGMCEMIVNITKEDCDIIMEFDVFVKRSDKGLYYCSQCIDRKYYSSRTAIWEEHVFEEMLKWINKLSTKHVFATLHEKWGCEVRLFDKNNIVGHFCDYAQSPVVINDNEN